MGDYLECGTAEPPVIKPPKDIPEGYSMYIGNPWNPRDHEVRRDSTSAEPTKGGVTNGEEDALRLYREALEKDLEQTRADTFGNAIARGIEDGCKQHELDQLHKAEDDREILDSGNRQQFITGSVRDMAVGKGRCDLMPLKVLARLHPLYEWLIYVDAFQENGNHEELYKVINWTLRMGNFEWRSGVDSMLLELSRHFEAGAQKYGEDNWKKGIPVNSYIDSAVRHFLKWHRGDKDERHDRAFLWNIVCTIWTCINVPEMNVYKKAFDERVKDHVSKLDCFVDV